MDEGPCPHSRPHSWESVWRFLPGKAEEPRRWDEAISDRYNPWLVPLAYDLEAIDLWHWGITHCSDVVRAEHAWLTRTGAAKTPHAFCRPGTTKEDMTLRRLIHHRASMNGVTDMRHYKNRLTQDELAILKAVTPEALEALGHSPAKLEVATNAFHSLALRFEAEYRALYALQKVEFERSLRAGALVEEPVPA